MALCTIHLLRHGEVHNPDGVLYGRLPGYRLSERGRAMADRIAERLGDGTHRVVRIVASPMERAQQTASPTAGTLDLPVYTDSRLIEAANHFQGMTFGVGEGSLRHPQHWRYLVDPFRPSWGEPYTEVARRMLSAVASVRQWLENASDLPGDPARAPEVLLVSHQMPIWIARLQLEGKRLWHNPRRRQCALASLTSLTYDGGRLVSIDYSEPAADLLPGAAPTPGA